MRGYIVRFRFDDSERGVQICVWASTALLPLLRLRSCLRVLGSEGVLFGRRCKLDGLVWLLVLLRQAISTRLQSSIPEPESAIKAHAWIFGVEEAVEVEVVQNVPAVTEVRKVHTHVEVVLV